MKQKANKNWKSEHPSSLIELFMWFGLGESEIVCVIY